MKRLFLGVFVMALVAGMLLVGACASEPEPEPEPEPDPGIQEIEVLEHRGSVHGVDTPEWVIKSLEGPAAIEQLPEYEDQYAFIFEERGNDLQGVEMWAQNFSAPSEVAQRVSTAVEQRFVGAAAGDVDRIETYMENVVDTTSQAEFSGLTRANEWWVRVRVHDPEGEAFEEEYRYTVLYTIQRDLMDEQVRRAIDEAAAEEELTDEEQTVRDRVKERFEQEGL